VVPTGPARAALALDDEPEPGGIPDMDLGEVEQQRGAPGRDEAVQREPQVSGRADVDPAAQGDMPTVLVLVLGDGHHTAHPVRHGFTPTLRFALLH
jgi:hypothetical protein